MSKADEIRDIVYINGHVNKKCFITYGIEFKEFYHSLPTPLANILLLKHGFEDSDYHYQTHMDYVEEEQIHLLAEDNVYNYGDFCWIDFEDISSLDLLEPQDIAALLYLGHLKKPLNSPFNNKLGNQFVYLAHDDGFYNKIYFRDVYDMKHILSRIIPLKMSAIKQKRFVFRRKKLEYPILPLVLANTLLTLTNDGLFIDFEHMVQSRRDIKIPLYTIGDFDDMNEMYNDRFEHKEMSKLQAHLVLTHKELEWSIEEVQ